jgi:DNA-directed RNA polymerase specialized sigma24 family protein
VVVPGARLDFRAVFVEHYAFVWRTLAHFGVPRSALDDASQEVFAVVHRRLGDYDGRTAVRSWLWGIARRVTSTLQRGELRARRRLEVVQPPREPAIPDEELEQGSMAGLSEEQLATFRERAVPQPAATLRDAVSLTDHRRLDVPGTVVCTAFSADSYRSYAEQGMPFLAGILEHTRLELVDLPTGHWPMWSRPARPITRAESAGMLTA